MDFGALLFSIAFTAFCYLCVPGCFCIMCWAYEKKLSIKAIKRIVFINGAVLWLIFTIIRSAQGISGNSMAVILWSSVAYWMLKKICLKPEK